MVTYENVNKAALGMLGMRGAERLLVLEISGGRSVHIVHFAAGIYFSSTVYPC